MSGISSCLHLTEALLSQLRRHLASMARSAPLAAATLIQHAFLEPCSTGQQDRLATPSSRGQALMEAVSTADSSRVSTGLLAAAASRHGLAEGLASALAQVGLAGLQSHVLHAVC